MGDRAAKTLYLLRHAKARKPTPGEDDRARPLVSRGRDAAGKMAEWFTAQGIEPDAVLCSPSVRTRETFEIVRSALGDVPVEFDPHLYGASSDELLKLIGKLPRAINAALIVGHNPGLEELALDLAGHGSARLTAKMREKFPTCALAVFTAPVGAWPGFAEASRIEAFIRPADLD